MSCPQMRPFHLGQIILGVLTIIFVVGWTWFPVAFFSLWCGEWWAQRGVTARVCLLPLPVTGLTSCPWTVVRIPQQHFCHCFLNDTRRGCHRGCALAAFQAPWYLFWPTLPRMTAIQLLPTDGDSGLGIALWGGDCWVKADVYFNGKGSRSGWD